MRDYALNTHRMRMRFDATRLPATYQAKLVDRFIPRLRMLSESERSVPVIAHVPLPAARMAPALQTRTPTAPDSRRVLVTVEPVAGRDAAHQPVAAFGRTGAVHDQVALESARPRARWGTRARVRDTPQGWGQVYFGSWRA
jgi:hypothetical protein